MKSYVSVIIITLILIVSAKFFTDGLISKKEYNLLKDKYNYLDNTYKTILNLHRNQSDLIFYNIINRPEVLKVLENVNSASEEEKKLIRKELKNKLQSLYGQLKNENFRQLHFHLKDNISFFRFHKPNFYGDSLAGVRKTVEYVNKNLKPAYGFEEGRIHNAYRFVYPLIYQGKHLGSVETSVSMNILKREFITNNNIHIDLLVKKSLVDDVVFDSEKYNYKRHPYFKDFILDKFIGKNSHIDVERLVFNNQELEEDLLKKNVLESVIKDNNKYYSFIFYPIKDFSSNKDIAYLFFIEESKELKDYVNTLYITYILFVVFIIFTSYHIIMQEFSRKELAKTEVEIKVLNDKLLKSNKDLDKSIQSQKAIIIHQSRLAQIGEMFSMLNHQLKQPLNSLSINKSTLMYLIKHEPSNFKDISKVDENINKSIFFMSDTIDTFKNFYKTGDSKSELSINDTVDNTLTILAPRIKLENIVLTKDYKDTITLNTYKNQLEQVIIALLSNAMDALAIADTKYINISTYLKDKNTACIKISDSGTGIPLDIQEKIFDAFYTTKEKAEGTGLGLHMCKIIVEDSLSGKLYFDSNEKGTNFYIELLF